MFRFMSLVFNSLCAGPLSAQVKKCKKMYFHTFAETKIVDGSPISCRVQLIIMLFCFSAACSNLTNTQGTDVDGRCPPLSNSAQTPPISHFTTFEWSLQQFHTALHRVRGSPSICERSTALHRGCPLCESQFTSLKWSQSHNFTLGGRQ